jgi:methylmalonyl-CoA mutase N-terminal domain/subunit
VFRIDPTVEASQVAAVAEVRERRDQQAVEAALADLRKASESGENILPATIEAVTAYATIGEVVAVLRDIHGQWRPTAAF